MGSGNEPDHRQEALYRSRCHNRAPRRADAVLTASGIYGVYQLSSSLAFVTEQAWSAADGAMEGKIGVQQQILGVEQIVAGRKRLAEGSEFGTEALQRMLGSGLFSDQERGQLDLHLQSYEAARPNVLNLQADFAAGDAALLKASARLRALMNLTETLGDGEVEALEQNAHSYDFAAPSEMTALDDRNFRDIS